MALQLENPHSVIAALETRPMEVEKVVLPQRAPSGYWKTAADLASRLEVRVERRSRGGERNRFKGQGRSRGSECYAIVGERKPTPLEKWAGEIDSNVPSVYLALDCIQDPRNVGAIFRTASFFGVKGILMIEDRSSPLSALVYDTASGGMEYVPFSVEKNLRNTLNVLKESGLWVLGTSERAELDLSEIDSQRPWMIVLGNEEKGMRRLVQESCDQVCRISSKGGVGSLNDSVSAGVLLSRLNS